MGILCPISVSAQDMGQNLVATLETELNFFGKIKSRTMDNNTTIQLPKIIPIGSKLTKALSDDTKTI